MIDINSDMGESFGSYRMGADEELLAVVGSWGDTLDDAVVLRMLREYNRTGKVLHRPQ